MSWFIIKVYNQIKLKMFRKLKILWIVIFVSSCVIGGGEKKTVRKTERKTERKAEKLLQVDITKPLVPRFEKVEIEYTKGQMLRDSDLEQYEIIELSLLRLRLYESNYYNFEKVWKELFYKWKYGYVIQPNYSQIKMSWIDKKNDQLLMTKIQKRKSFVELPIYTSHITKETKRARGMRKYFWNIVEKKDFLIGFEDKGIPLGIFEPVVEKEIGEEIWEKLILGIGIDDLGYEDEDLIVYEVKYYLSGQIKYIISHEVYGGYMDVEDGRSFSIYDKRGILIRHMYIVGNQEIYERDYIYTEDNKKVRKIIEKVIINNQLSRLEIYRRNVYQGKE